MFFSLLDCLLSGVGKGFTVLEKSKMADHFAFYFRGSLIDFNIEKMKA